MKLKSISIIALLLLTLSGCAAAAEDQVSTPSEKTYERPKITSSVKVDECSLCGENAKGLLSWYMGQDNLGLLNVNTFDVHLIEINRYDDSGNQIMKTAGYMSMGGSGIGDSHVHAMTDPDRGISHVDVTPSENPIDEDSLAKHLCQECLDAFTSNYYTHDHPCEVAVINFATKEIHPLVETCPWFTTDNFSVDCDFEEDGGIELTIHYSPLRFED